MKRWRQASWWQSKLAFHVTLPGRATHSPASGEAAARETGNQSPSLHGQNIPGTHHSLNTAEEGVIPQPWTTQTLQQTHGAFSLAGVELWCLFPALQLPVCWGPGFGKWPEALQWFSQTPFAPVHLDSLLFLDDRTGNEYSSGFAPSLKLQSTAGKVCACNKFAGLPMQCNFLKLQVSKTHRMHFLNFTEYILPLLLALKLTISET